MNAQNTSRGFLIGGVLLLVVALLWPYLLPKGMLWDDQRAVELTNASEALHATMHEHGANHDHFGETNASENPEVAAAAQKYRETQSELENAKLWTNSVPAFLRLTGIVASLVGVAVYFVGRSA